MPGWFLPTINSSHSTADRRAVWSPDLLTGADGCQNTMGSGMRSQSNTLDNISQPPLLGKMPLSSRYPEVEFEKSTTGALIRKNATRYSLLLVLISVMATWFYICPVPLPVFFRSATGKTVTYNWDISWVLANPDGELVRPVIGINGEWPLPTLYADVGDRVIVNVKNSLGNETTSIHWHGLFQRGSTAMDGPVGVTQCPIPADGTMTYNFKVSLRKCLPFSKFMPDLHLCSYSATIALYILTKLRSRNQEHTFITLTRMVNIPTACEVPLLFTTRDLHTRMNMTRRLLLPSLIGTMSRFLSSPSSTWTQYGILMLRNQSHILH
jgi:hypothetical protein